MNTLAFSSATLSTSIETPCRIIGVLDDGVQSLTPRALNYIQNANVIIGGTRTLQLFESHIQAETQCLDLTGQLSQVPEWIRHALSEKKAVIVLATGDPLCHGIASFLQAKLCIEACEVLPNVSTVQLACARIGLPWQGLKICSVHSRDAGEWFIGGGLKHGLYPVLQATQHHDRIAVFTGPDNSPDRIARMLLLEGLDDDFRLAVAECLRQDNERILTALSVNDAAKYIFAEPNIMLLWRDTPRSNEATFGLPDTRFHQRKPDKGLITKREIRAVSLARLQLHSKSVVWDIGAGSGAVGLEAARLAPQGYVYAVEKNVADVAIAHENRQRLGVHNYALSHAKAPEGLEAWPDPDAVFIGGSGGELADLIQYSLERLTSNGVLVMNFVTFENLAMATDTLKKLNADWDVTQMQVSRSKPILHMQRLAAENPVWIVCAKCLPIPA